MISAIRRPGRQIEYFAGLGFCEVVESMDVGLGPKVYNFGAQGGWSAAKSKQSNLG